MVIIQLIALFFGIWFWTLLILKGIRGQPIGWGNFAVVAASTVAFVAPYLGVGS